MNTRDGPTLTTGAGAGDCRDRDSHTDPGTGNALATVCGRLTHLNLQAWSCSGRPLIVTCRRGLSDGPERYEARIVEWTPGRYPDRGSERHPSRMVRCAGWTP